MQDPHFEALAQKDHVISALREDKKSLEVTVERFRSALIEKDAEIQRLRSALAMMENEIFRLTAEVASVRDVVRLTKCP